MNEKLLKVENLKVSYHTYAGEVQAVRGVSFELNEGETIALVGESGCGKSVTARSLMRLNKVPPAEIKEESKVLFQGKDIYQLSEKELCQYRGGSVSMIFQDAMAALNPTMTIGNQIVENIRHHSSLSKKEAMEKAIVLLKKVGLSEPNKRIKQYPHELSGGMRQRVMIAIAFANEPKLLIADEPTTALDVTIQAQIVQLLKRLNSKKNTAILFISHDLSLVRKLCTKVIVMQNGHIVERGNTEDIYQNPQEVYTKQLIAAIPKCEKNFE